MKKKTNPLYPELVALRINTSQRNHVNQQANDIGFSAYLRKLIDADQKRVVEGANHESI